MAQFAGGAQSAYADVALRAERRTWHPLVIVACMIGVAFGVSGLFSQGSTPASRNLRDRLLAGDILGLGLQDLVSLAVIAGRMFLPALLMLAALRLVEYLANPERDRRTHRVVWLTQIVFVSATPLISFASVKFGLGDNEPLISVGARNEFPGSLLITVPLWLAVLLVTDFLTYWLHRATHAVPAFWRLHSLHHSPRNLGVLYELTHPLEAVLAFLAVTLPVALLVRLDLAELYVLTTIFGLHHFYVHMNVPVSFGRFRLIIADNRYHFLHHSRHEADWNHNFCGLFPIWDILFGTYKRPTEELAETGIPGVGEPTTFGQYMMARSPSEATEQRQSGK